MKTGVVAVLVAAFAWGPAHAQSLRADRIYADGVVLQRDVPILVRGTAAPGARVRAELDGTTAEGAASPAGRWELRLPAHGAGGPYTLTLSAGSQRQVVRAVLVGDVWLASGQSNMEWPLVNATGGEAAIGQADDAQLREFAVPHTWSWWPETDVKGGEWKTANPANAGGRETERGE